MSDFYVVMSELIHDPKILQMKNYAQHNSSNTFKHSVHVALTAYRLSKIFHLKIDESSLAKGAMLHDFYLYDARGGQIGAWKHGTGHADTALNNSLNTFLNSSFISVNVLKNLSFIILSSDFLFILIL